MGGIGDYVHLSARGYVNHGVTKRGAFQAYKSRKEIINQKAKKLGKTGLSEQDRSELAGILQSMTQMGANPNNENLAEAQRYLQEKMTELFKQEVQTIDWSTGNVTTNSSHPHVGQVRTQKSVLDENHFVKKIQQLEEALLQQVSNGLVGADITLKDRLGKLKREYETTIREIQKDLKNRNLPSAKASANRAKIKNIKDEYNNIVKYWASYPPVFLQKGVYFEHLISLAPRVANNAAMDAIGKVIGGESEKIIINKDKFQSKYLTKEFENKVFVNTKASQGKVDVEMNWKGRDLNISAKNINIKDYTRIHLVSDTSLLFLLQDEPAPFVNHALNILSRHTGREGIQKINSMRADMLQELRLIALYKALTGDAGGRKKANTFIVNDNATGRVQVYDVGEIIEKAMEGNNLSSAVGVPALGANWRLFSNARHATSAAERISGLLADVHERKISVTLSVSALPKSK